MKRGFFLFVFVCFFVCFFGGEGVLSSIAFTIWCCIPISRPPRVFRRFKRRSCFINYLVGTWYLRSRYIGQE